MNTRKVSARWGSRIERPEFTELQGEYTAPVYFCVGPLHSGDGQEPYLPVDLRRGKLTKRVHLDPEPSTIMAQLTARAIAWDLKLAETQDQTQTK